MKSRLMAVLKAQTLDFSLFAMQYHIHINRIISIPEKRELQKISVEEIAS